MSCHNKRLLKLLVSQTKNRILHLYYKQYCKVLKKTVYASKKLGNKHSFQNSRNKTKSMWQIINRETKKNTPKTRKNIQIKTSDNITLNRPKEIADFFNTFFTSVGSSLNSNKINRVPSTNIINNYFFLNPVEPREIFMILKNLTNKSSFGIDEITPTLIKSCAEVLTIPYTQLINQSFSEGVFPDALKIALVKPIHKKGKITDANNYRPIALLPTSAKIFETAMMRRLYPFYEKFRILHDSQNGFRQNRSTTLAVYKYIQQIIKAIDCKKYAIGLLLDMSKAYDRVCYKTLLYKLHNTGVRGMAHEWFKSYLSNRAQYVEIESTDFQTGKIKRTRSDRMPVNGSIPQGSVLGVACSSFISTISLTYLTTTACSSQMTFLYFCPAQTL